MSVLIFIDHADGHIKKTSLEALSYGAALAKQTGVSAEGILLGTISEALPALGKYGISKIHHIAEETLNHLDAEQYIRIISAVAEAGGATILILLPYQYRKGDRTWPFCPFKGRARIRCNGIARHYEWIPGEKKCVLRKSLLHSFHQNTG
jgi:hypothetical protein